MTFRDDIDAAYARLEVLESENRKLVEDNAKLRGIPLPPRARLPEDHDAVLVRIEDLEHSNRRLAAENERMRNRGAPPPPPEAPHKPWPGSDGSQDFNPSILIAVSIALGLAMLIVRALH